MPVVYGYTKSYSTSKKWQYLYHSTGDSPLMNGHYLSGGCQHFSHPGKLYLTAYAVVNVASQMWSNSVRKLQNNFDLCPTCIYCYSYWHFLFFFYNSGWVLNNSTKRCGSNIKSDLSICAFVTSLFLFECFLMIFRKGSSVNPSSWGVFMLSFCEIKSQYVINIHWLIETCANLDKIQFLSPNHSLYNYNEFEIQYLVS